MKHEYKESNNPRYRAHETCEQCGRRKDHMLHTDKNKTGQTTLKTPLEAIALEIDRAQRMYPPINNIHEGYAIILEELDEFWEECRQKPEHRSDHRLAKELVQVAAMAIRTLEDCCEAR